MQPKSKPSATRRPSPGPCGGPYPDAVCSLDFHTPLELLVATILSAQCTDQRVNLVTKDLFRKYRTAADYAQAPAGRVGTRHPEHRLLTATRPRTSRAPAGVLAEQYGGEVPRELEKLVELPGVGRKTANVVLGTAFGIASGVVVDTHVGAAEPAAGAHRAQGRREDRAGPDGAASAEGVDRLQPPHDPARPAGLHGAKAPVRRVARCDDLSARSASTK